MRVFDSLGVLVEQRFERGALFCGQGKQRAVAIRGAIVSAYTVQAHVKRDPGTERSTQRTCRRISLWGMSCSRWPWRPLR